MFLTFAIADFPSPGCNGKIKANIPLNLAISTLIVIEVGISEPWLLLVVGVSEPWLLQRSVVVIEVWC